jgi:hypothetical protein
MLVLQFFNVAYPGLGLPSGRVRHVPATIKCPPPYHQVGDGTTALAAC